MEIVYCIKNNINGKSYIGRTSRGFDHRYYKGKWWRYTCSPSLRAAAHKYGKDQFTVSILYRTKSKADCMEKEIELIRSLKTLCPNGYNNTDEMSSKGQRNQAVFNNNNRHIYTLLNMVTGRLVCTDSLLVMAQTTDYSHHSFSKKVLTIGRRWGEWKLVEITLKPTFWEQKRILYNVVTKKWVYGNNDTLRALLGTKTQKAKLAMLLDGERKRVGDWVLYANRNTWQIRQPKSANIIYHLIAPNGDTVIVHHLPQFCRQQGLGYQEMMKMIAGTREQYRGWTRPDSKIVSRPIDTILVTHLASGKVTTHSTRATAQKQIKCANTAFRKLFHGQTKSHNGFTMEVVYRYSSFIASPSLLAISTVS